MNIFNSVKGLHPKRNKFTADTYRNDFTAPLGVNIPCFWAELPPATRFKVSASALVRLQALIAPVMDNIDYYVHFWQIPYRLIENDRFTKFISGEIEAEDYDSLFATPYELGSMVMSVINDQSEELPDVAYNKIFGNGSLLDFLGYDVSLFPEVYYDEEAEQYKVRNGNNTTKVNWRCVIAYYMLHVNWYMNENVPYFKDFVTLVDDYLVKQQSLLGFALLLYRTSLMNDHYVCMLPHGWDKDYFTSALPNVQYGDPVTLPIAGSAPVTLEAGATTPIHIGANNSSVGLVLGTGKEDEFLVQGQSNLQINADTSTQINGELLDETSTYYIRDLYGTLRTPLEGNADLSEATAITINELRFANALQVFKERQMRFGRRRLEYYKGFFDVVPEDLRLQVPKYLGGGRIPINIADIEQTSQTSGTSALGHLAGKATAVAGGFAGFSTFCSEETVILGIAFAIPHITYAQQLSRFKLKTNDIYDYFNPSFEHLGEQAIKNIEVFAGSVTPDKDFGYTPRYTEYRFHSNEMHGEFKGSLSYWSLGRIFDSQPSLNAQFVYMQPSVFDRIFAVSGQPNMIVSMLFHTRAIKPVSKYGTPMLLA